MKKNISIKNITNISNKPTIRFVLILVVITTSMVFGVGVSNLHAEQSGSSPDSGGATSVLVGGYNLLVSKGTNYGSSSSPDWTNNWGTYWNRIMYSATWEPDGTATASDVLSGKTFYAGSANRTIKTGTAVSFGPDYSEQQYVVYDDLSGVDYEGEESEWTNTNALSGSEVWYDTRTGLYWARSEPSTSTNLFTISTCDFYSTEPRGDYDGSDGDCGNAINACGTLSLASTQGESNDTDWYLPSQKEIKQAFIDGMYNQAGSSFTTGNYYWSTTEDDDDTRAWQSNAATGLNYNNVKTNTYDVHCVRRD